MHSLRIITLAPLAAIVICSGCWGIPVSNNTNRCVPPWYPKFDIRQMESSVVVTLRTEDTVNIVRGAYNDWLQPEEWTTKRDVVMEALWRMTSYSDGYLYECITAVNHYEVERGCIFVKRADSETEILLTWTLSESSVGGCQGTLTNRVLSTTTIFTPQRQLEMPMEPVES